jgi:large subunit ribosomal protein L4
MPQITLKNAAGKDAGTVDLDDATFGIQPNVPVMHQVVTAQLAARRAGTQSTKTRSTVRGGGRKPFRQKGTGNARQGSTRSPQFTGGAVALGPQPRKYDQKTPKKMISLALRSALSDRAAECKVVVVDSWGWDKPSTKSAAKALAGLGVEGRVLVVVGRDDAAAALSFRNMPEVQLIAPGELNAYDVLCNDYVVFTQNLLPVFTGSSKADAAGRAGVAEPTADVEGATQRASADDESERRVEASADGEGAIEQDEWSGSAKPLADGSTPAGFDIKGNKDSMLYHVPGSRFYKQTKAEVWFDSEQSAEAAGFSKPASQQAAEAEAAAENEESE